VPPPSRLPDPSRSPPCRIDRRWTPQPPQRLNSRPDEGTLGFPQTTTLKKFSFPSLGFDTHVWSWGNGWGNWPMSRQDGSRPNGCSANTEAGARPRRARVACRPITTPLTLVPIVRVVIPMVIQTIQPYPPGPNGTDDPPQPDQPQPNWSRPVRRCLVGDQGALWGDQEAWKNSWRVIVYAGRDPLSGRKRQKIGSAKTRAEAKQLEARLITEAATGRHRTAGAKTVADLLEAWYQWRQAVRPISPNTLANYRRYIDQKILPALGKVPVGRLDVATLDLFCAELRQRAASASTATGACVMASRRCAPERSSTCGSPARTGCTRA
jgi:Phage integrase, N-terminal SAM-like domain